jgi:hypothetical protein
LRAGKAHAEQADETIEAETNGHEVSFLMDARFLTDMLKVWPEDAVVSMHQAQAGRGVLFCTDQRPG